MHTVKTVCVLGVIIFIIMVALFQGSIRKIDNTVIEDTFLLCFVIAYLILTF